MLGHLSRAGWEFVRDPSQADVIVVNTCSFIEPAREESIRAILDAAEHKKSGSLKRLIVAGCMVQRYGDDLRRDLPEVDEFVDLDELPLIVERVADRALPSRTPSDLPLVSATAPRMAARSPESWHASSYLYDDRTPRLRATPPWTAYLKIAEGCDHSCSFCAIPAFRGSFRSRTLSSVAAEAARLGNEGVREINLIAQDTSHYGRDLGLRDGLAALLARLDEIDAIRWIRLHYLYPNTITDKLIAAMARASRVVDYVDLPLQHAHPATLRRMRRGGSAVSHSRLLERFRRAMPEVALRTTFIVGFPGESDEEFESLMDFVREVRFDHLGVFAYSHEEGTTAHGLADDVPTELKRERRERLMECQQSIAFERNASMLGRVVEVLVEGVHPETEHLLVGRTARQAPDVDGQVLIQEGSALPGDFVRVELRETAGYDLVGGIVGPSSAPGIPE
jgi:ribosomal protein S12 methylthiotransferase